MGGDERGGEGRADMKVTFVDMDDPFGVVPGKVVVRKMTSNAWVGWVICLP
jgi:hypothetical protein